ncbi:hypothetical protein [Flavobacterium limi]|uniref:Lipoprotein n=1 Tax=Flavobacterium limi TaxID=2045105 RepID=A0ABQ1TX42_9FLAO|nr:hypothetical protein [Flavobacterium limi]GGF03748.1 hypothetical protein GCM10011518_11120 [Flavobacterium limi]
MKKIILSMSLMAAMFFISCENNSVNEEVQSSALSNESTVSNQSKTAKLLAADCTPVADNVVVNRITGGLTGNYCDWTPTAKTIGLVSVQFEGIYGSGIRPTTAGWYVGVVAPNATCTTNGWSTIAAGIDVKNLNTGTIGVDPSCGSFIPQNVVGAVGPAYGLDFGTVGFYTYNSTTRVITITKKVVIWRDDFHTAATAYSDPTKTNGDITDAYLVEITSIVPTHGASVFGTVSYTYTKVL